MTTNENGWVKFHRNVQNWEWYKTNNALQLFFHLVIEANHKEKKWMGQIIERGSFITSFQKLSEQTGISVRSIRTLLNKFTKSKEIDVITTNKNTKIVIKNYDKYQGDDSKEIKPTPKKQNKKRNTPTPVEGNMAFIEPQNQSALEKLEKDLIWSKLIAIYTPKNDKYINEKRCMDKQRRLWDNFTKPEQEKILEWFGKYKLQLELDNPWISNFFNDKSNINDVGAYFFKIKDLKPKETPIKKFVNRSQEVSDFSSYINK